MEDYEQKTSPLTWLLGGLSALLLAGGVYFWNGNNVLTRQTDRAERRADSLLSVRLQLETDLGKLNEELATVRVGNTSLNSRIDEANRQLTRTHASLRELRRDNVGRLLTIRDLNQNVVTLTTQRDSMGNQMAAMRTKLTWLSDSGIIYQNRNSQLKQELTQRNNTLLTMVPRTALTGDGFQVEAVKANQKETAKASKVAELAISLNVPAELGLTGQQEVFLSLIDEGGKAIVTPFRNETVNLPTLNETIPVHAVQSVVFGPAQQRITFRLTPDVKLKPGLYRAAVYTKHTYLGAVEFRFRDSFWFF